MEGLSTSILNSEQKPFPTERISSLMLAIVVDFALTLYLSRIYSELNPHDVQNWLETSFRRVEISFGPETIQELTDLVNHLLFLNDHFRQVLIFLFQQGQRE